MRHFTIILTVCAALLGCTSTPEGVVPVTNFSLPSYLGKWHEIARLPHSFEEGLSHVTATYTLREDGGVKVLNRGYDQGEKQWDEAEGKAYFVGDKRTAHLKVSFFGPFYASYIVVDLDENYQYAMVSGPDKDYLWILSRTPELKKETLQRLVSKAKKLGYDTHSLIYVDQSAVKTVS